MAEQGVTASELGVIRRFDRVEWVDEARFGRAPAEVTEAARAQGARRKFFSQGEQGIYVQYSTLPPGFRIAPHSHTHGEVLFVLAGGCTVEPSGEVLGPRDAAVIPAGQEYGLTCGEDGMEFLTLRAGDARTEFTG